MNTYGVPILPFIFYTDLSIHKGTKLQQIAHILNKINFTKSLITMSVHV